MKEFFRLFAVDLLLQWKEEIVFCNEFDFAVNTFKPSSTNPKKWSNTLKQFVDNLSMNCLSVFDDFLGLARKGLKGIHKKRKINVVKTSNKEL